MSEFDCTACGICCSPLRDQPVFCDLTEADLKKLDARWIKKHVEFSRPFDLLVAAIDRNYCPAATIRAVWRKQKTGPLAGVDVVVCAALRGSLMHKTRCTIYERRPKVCREAVRPGDRSCRKARKVFMEMLAREVGAR